jgi:hypothetical protein
VTVPKTLNHQIMVLERPFYAFYRPGWQQPGSLDDHDTGIAAGQGSLPEGFQFAVASAGCLLRRTLPFRIMVR